MAKVKVVNTNLDQNLNGISFTHTTSETIFQFGSFAVTSNFSGRVPIDYTNTLSSFVRPVTLETLGVNTVQSGVLFDKTTNAILNLDKTNLNTFIRFGSSYEFLRVSVQEIILAYPASLFANSKVNPAGNPTFKNFSYNHTTNISTFYVPTGCTVNKFGLVYNAGNLSKPSDMEIKNLNLSYDKYAIWSKNLPDQSFSLVSFSGYNTNNSSLPNYKYSIIQVFGNPFPFITGVTTNVNGNDITTIAYGYFDFHIRPNNVIFDEFRTIISNYEQYMMSQRDGTNGFIFNINDPTLLDDGSVTYSNTQILWNTTDGYNIDINTNAYQRFLQILLTIGAKYDQIKTDLIARFLTPASIKTYDLTQDGKMTKLLRIYGWEFDKLREFIDSLVYINTVTYDKVNNIPDQLIQNLARTFGWDYFNLVNEEELVNNVLNIDTGERNLNTDLLPAEVNIELWRRILINTNYFWKSKGTRQAIKAMFLMIGIPEPFINITEYVYTVDGKINPNTVPLIRADFPSNSFPYDKNGYPVAPVETNSFYFQVSGDTDAGQTYMNAFRMAGFDLMLTVDNRKSWIQTGATTRIDDSTPQYFQADSKLVLNTKEVDVALDTARGIEYDVYDYIKKDYAINNSGYTMPFSYVNISLGVSAVQNTFPLPQKTEGDFEVRYNGILLNAPKTGLTSGITYQADYSATTNSFTILNNNYAYNNSSRRDVIQVTYIYSGGTHPITGITVEYIVTRVKANLSGTIIPLPSFPRGDVQVTINGIALTKGTPQFIADYILDPNNTTGSSQIIIQNPEVIGYLAVNPYVQVAYVEVNGSNDINARSEIVRVDSFNSSKIYYNVGANKYVYRLNYKVNSASDVKFLIDGIALEPFTDYSINVLDPYEVFLPSGIRYGTVISAYYLVGGNAYFTPIVSDDFGLGDISQLSFLEFIDLIQRKMINARNRKTVSDFKGGWYPALLRLYELYLDRGLLPDNDPLHSNGYTFANLYPFLSKYNAFFQKFVDQLLSATIILRGGGLLIRNTVFTKQKFTYKRGVNIPMAKIVDIDKDLYYPQSVPLSAYTPAYSHLLQRATLQYRGDDGSQFRITQSNAPPPIILHVDTCNGTVGTLGPGLGYINTGGFLVSGYTNLTNYGMQYKKSINPLWCIYPSPLTNGSLGVNHYSRSISGLDEGVSYDYRAIVQISATTAYGDKLTAQITPPLPLIPSGNTKAFTSATISSFIAAGGCDIQGYQSIQWYNMRYRTAPSGLWQCTPFIAGPLAINTYSITIPGLSANTSYEYQSIFIVGGNTYSGKTSLFGTTLPIPTSAPTVMTGIAPNPALINGYLTCGHCVCSNGNSTIQEYGILYTANPLYNSNSTLIYSNVDAINVCKASTGSSIAIGVPYSAMTTGLPANTTTYYRAFAKNAVGAGYGDIYPKITAAPAAPVTAILCMTFSHQTFTNPHSRIAANLNCAVGGMVCISEAHIEGYNVGGSAIVSNTMGISCSTCICFDGSSSSNCSAKTDQTPGDDASWTSATGYSYSAPAVKVNGTLISVCPTTISVGLNFVEVRFPISCISL